MDDMRKTVSVLFGVAALIGVTGCSSPHTIDRAAWERDLAENGDTVNDWRGFEDLWVNDICTKDDLGFFVAIGLDEGQSPDYIRMNFRNACPDRLGDVEETLDSLREGQAATDEACSLPGPERTDEQSLRAEAIGCD